MSSYDDTLHFATPNTHHRHERFHGHYPEAVWEEGGRMVISHLIFSTLQQVDHAGGGSFPTRQPHGTLSDTRS